MYVVCLQLMHLVLNTQFIKCIHKIVGEEIQISAWLSGKLQNSKHNKNITLFYLNSDWMCNMFMPDWSKSQLWETPRYK